MIVFMSVPESRGIDIKSQQPKMFKSLSALAIFALLGASVIALPAFAPNVEAGEVGALAKGDRLEVRAPASNCSTQVWPNFAASCLRNPGSGVKILEARLVTARR